MAQDDDRRVFEEKVTGLLDQVYGAALRLAKNREDAEDLMVAFAGEKKESIFKAVSEMYTEVARHPDRQFHFPTGRPACLFVGYPSVQLDAIPGTAVESFAGVGYPFAVGANEAPRSKLRGITELNFADFSEAEANPVASYGEYSSSTCRGGIDCLVPIVPSPL